MLVRFLWPVPSSSTRTSPNFHGSVSNVLGTTGRPKGLRWGPCSAGAGAVPRHCPRAHSEARWQRHRGSHRPPSPTPGLTAQEGRLLAGFRLHVDKVIKRGTWKRVKAHFTYTPRRPTRSGRRLLRVLVTHQPGKDLVVYSTFRATHPILEPAGCLSWANREV